MAVADPNYLAGLVKNPIGRPAKAANQGKTLAQRKRDQRERLDNRAAAHDFDQTVCLHVLNNKKLREQYGVLACQALEKILSQ